MERRTSISSGTPRYDEGVTGDTLRLDARCPTGNWFVIGSICQVDYVVQVPAGFDVAARTDAGDLLARDVDGDVDLNSDAGDIELTGTSGDLLANTDAGNVAGRSCSRRSLLVGVLADAQLLPHRRSRAGDRHLKFYETRDNLSLCRISSTIGSEAAVNRPGESGDSVV